MSTTRKRSNVVAKALLLTALASGIAGMQAMPAGATQYFNYDISSGSSFNIPKQYLQGDFFYNPNDTVLTVNTSAYSRSEQITLKGGVLYSLCYTTQIVGITENNPGTERTWLQYCTALGDAKSILGGSSSSGLSEEQKTMIKDLIANWPGLCRLVEKFFKRNDDNNEYDKKT